MARRRAKRKPKRRVKGRAVPRIKLSSLHAPLDLKAFSIACAVLWAIVVALAGIVAIFGLGTPLIDLLSSLYIGFDTSLTGILIGIGWGLVDGLIAGVIFAWVYNKFIGK